MTNNIFRQKSITVLKKIKKEKLKFCPNLSNSQVRKQVTLFMELCFAFLFNCLFVVVFKCFARALIHPVLAIFYLACKKL